MSGNNLSNQGRENGPKPQNTDNSVRQSQIDKIEAELQLAFEGKHPRISLADAPLVRKAFRQYVKKGQDPTLALENATSEMVAGDDGTAASVFHSPRHKKTARGGSQARS